MHGYHGGPHWWGEHECMEHHPHIHHHGGYGWGHHPGYGWGAPPPPPPPQYHGYGYGYPPPPPPPPPPPHYGYPPSYHSDYYGGHPEMYDYPQYPEMTAEQEIEMLREYHGQLKDTVGKIQQRIDELNKGKEGEK